MKLLSSVLVAFAAVLFACTYASNAVEQEPWERSEPAAEGVRVGGLVLEEEEEEEQLKQLLVEEVLPSDSLLVILFPDLRRTWESFDKSSVGRILAEPDVVSYIQRIRLLSSFREMREETGLKTISETGLSPSKIREVFRRRAAIALVRGPTGTRLVLVAAVEEGREVLQDLVYGVVDQMRKKDPSVNLDSHYHKELEIRTISSHEAVYGYTYLENLFILAIGEGTVELLVDTYLSGRKATLASNVEFRKRFGKYGSGTDLFYHTDVRRLKTALAEHLSPQGKNFLESLVEAGALYVTGCAYFEGISVQERVVLEGTGQKAPTMPGYLAEPIKIDSAMYAPVDTILFGAFSADWAAMFEQYRLALNEASVDLKNIPGLSFTSLLKPGGAELERELPSAFRGEASFALMMSPGSPYPEALSTLHVNQEAAATRLLTTMEDVIRYATGSRFSTDRYGSNLIIRYLSLQGEQMEMLKGILSPAYVMTGETVLIGSSVKTVKKALRQKRFPSSAISAKADFKNVIGEVENPIMVYYMDVVRLVEEIYGKLLPLIAMQGIGRDLVTELPQVETLTKHLHGVGVVGEIIDNTVRIRARSPAGVLLYQALGLMAQAPDFFASGGSAIFRANADNLREIGVGLHLYASDFDRFPQALSELYPAYVRDLRVFQAPNGKGEVRTKADINTKSDYTYVPGRSLNELSDEILVYDKDYVHSGKGRQAVLMDLSVVFIDEDALTDRLAGLIPVLKESVGRTLGRSTRAQARPRRAPGRKTGRGR